MENLRILWIKYVKTWSWSETNQTYSRRLLLIRTIIIIRTIKCLLRHTDYNVFGSYQTISRNHLPKCCRKSLLLWPGRLLRNRVLVFFQATVESKVRWSRQPEPVSPARNWGCGTTHYQDRALTNWRRLVAPGWFVFTTDRVKKIPMNDTTMIKRD